jgi:ligand-binding sensor domain-containing protein/serine phosphatase RsbU (regulator of sigma subunit)
MKFHIFKKISFSTLVCLFLFADISFGQAYKFRNYGAANNLPSEVIYTLIQDNSGYLWVGTTEGLSRFDGFEFFKVQFPDSSTGRYPTVSFKDRNGNLWFGCNDGTLFYASGRMLKQTTLPNSSGTGISSILEGPDGSIYVIAQRKPVFRIDPIKPNEAEIISFSPDPSMFSASFTDSGELLIGTQDNLMICKIAGDSLVTSSVVEGFDYSRIMSIHRMKNGSSFIIGTDGNGLFRFQIKGNNKILSRFTGYPGLETLPVKSITGSSQNNIWVSTAGSGAVKMQFLSNSDSLVSVRYLDKSSGLAGDNIITVFEDAEENIWLGFNGDGLSILTTDSFEFHAPGENNKPNSIIYSGKLGDDYLLGTPSGFYIYNLSSRKPVSFTSMPTQTAHREINSYFIDNDENIWMGTNGSGLYVKSKSGPVIQFYKSGDTGADYISDISITGDDIWLATLNGVSIISRLTKALKNSYNVNNGLPTKGINQILPLEDGSCYVATESDKLYRIDPDSGIFVSDASMYGILLNKVLALARDSKGVIWAATQGNGVFECNGDSVKSLTTANGLLSNYTYSILADKEDNIWIGHERGISRYNQKTGIIKVYSTDFAKGGTCNANAIYESPDGKIFIGTTEGLIIYDRSKDLKNQKAPVNNINSITINNVEYPYQPSFSLPYKKRYNVRVNYAGINFSNPEKVYYSTFLENYDEDWTKPSGSREVTYNLRDGNYKFSLVSVNEDGLTQENPLTFEISIKQPVWRSWWFILSLIGIAVGIVILIIRQREKAQKKIQEYLEKELEARTKVVMQQKAVLEIQNLEITDSINYAKRIQSSILPDIKRLKEHFGDAFIMLYPRDIVSGDFYWFDKLDDDRFILVCADSTGHGVPGALMSMIGSTLLQDIVSRQRISKPSEILTMLDKQIFATLNQNLEVGVSNDGMDIVVCEFTLKNRHIRFASAMRPVLIVMGGETYYIKGNRASVGGQTIMEKYFDDQEYYLNEGDTIYMFTDGLPDQFGGPDGKKMKIARLKKIIGEIYTLPVDQQEEVLTKFYRKWKGEYEQVDDILFMGVRV